MRETLAVGGQQGATDLDDPTSGGGDCVPGNHLASIHAVPFQRDSPSH